ncbi:MAG TPA: cob(I)yrinic acid a,c-diamide adenosyltransferase [Patescibacteria group bacterium]
MSKIYTKTGDRGQTSLFDGTRVPKNNIRVETYGTIDELNSVIGVVISEIQNLKVKTQKHELRIKKELINIQKDLFEIGSSLANPKAKFKIQDTKYFESRIESFEKLIDQMTAKLPILTNFILPGGGKSGASLHVARSVVRRVERRIIELSQNEEVDGIIVKYFNRLSDLFFTMSRFMNFKEKKKEVIWKKR